MTDNELREELKDVLCQIAGREVEPDKRLVEFIKQHTDRARWQEVRAMLNIPEPSRTKLLRDRLNQLKESE